MSDSVIIKLDGEDSSYSKVLSLAEKKAKETAEKARKAVDDAHKAMQKANDKTDDSNEKLAEDAAKHAKDAADKAIAEAERAAKEYKDIQDEIGKRQSEMARATSEGVDVINNSAKKIAGTLLAAGTAVVGIGVNYNSQMEQYQAGFTTMLGNAEKAQVLMNDLKDFAASTPFEMTDLADASTTLLAFGDNVNSIMPHLKMLGDISLGNKEKFKSLALVFGQVQSQGRLMGQDLLQMINAGFNPLQIISEKTGKSVAQLKEEMADGAISFEMVADAMQTATSAGGQFYNAMEAQSKTTAGQLSTLKDNITALFGKISESASEMLAEDVLPEIIEFIEWVDEKADDGSLEKWFKNGAVAVGTLGAAIVAMNAGLFINDLVNITRGVKNYTAATKLGTTAQHLHNAAVNSNPYVLLATVLATVISALVTYNALTESAAEKIESTTDRIVEKNKELVESYEISCEAIEERQNKAELEARQVGNLTDKLIELEERIKSGQLTDEEATEAKNKFNTAAAELESIVPGITSSLYDETGAIDVQVNSVKRLTEAYKKLVLTKAALDANQERLSEAMKAFADSKDDLKEAVDVELEAKALYDTEVNEQYEMYKTMEDIQGEAFAGILEFFYDGIIKPFDTSVEDAKSAYNETLKATEQALKIRDDFEAKVKEIEEDVNNASEAYLDALTEYETLSGGNGGSPRTYSGSRSSGGSTKPLSDMEKAIQSLKYAQEDGLISEEEYFKERKRLRDTYVKEDTDEWRKHTQEINTAFKKWYDKEKDDLEYKYKTGLIGEHEYYSQLAVIRDSFLKTDSEEWRKYTLQLSQYISQKKDEILNTWRETLKEFEEEKEAFSDSLEAKNKGYQTYTFHGDTTESYTSLADLNIENSQLEKYDKLLTRYAEKANGDIPKFVAEQLKRMSAEEGIKYLTALVNSSDEEFMEYMDNINRNTSLAEGISSKLFDGEAEELRRKFEETFNTLPSEFFDFGEESGEQFGKGFEKALDLMMDSIKMQIASEYGSIIPDVIINATPNQTGGSIYNDNRVSHWNIAANSPRQAMEVFKANQQYEAHTSKYGG